MNCAALPEQLLESELFGHERGAFTGADRLRKRGCSRPRPAARCFSTRSASCRCRLQAKLLRVLEERKVMRVGGDRTIQVDVRVIAATNRDLEREVDAGRFRAGSLLSPQRPHAACPAAARAVVRRSRACRSSASIDRVAPWHAAEDDRGGGRRAALRVRLAEKQRPRAA